MNGSTVNKTVDAAIETVNAIRIIWFNINFCVRASELSAGVRRVKRRKRHRIQFGFQLRHSILPRSRWVNVCFHLAIIRRFRKVQGRDSSSERIWRWHFSVRTRQINNQHTTETHLPAIAKFAINYSIIIIHLFAGLSRANEQSTD